ncbi:MAG: DUF502 domain-containing protein [Phycisphaerales bacterium]|jgi:uncharacterized membrane protein|nr:DUF502 domain-containing protein [Phycisphaerales bacterium]
MKAKPRRTFWGDFKLFFGKGLAILLPSVVTLWLLWQAFVFVFNNVAAPINRGIRIAVIDFAPRVLSPGEMPAWYQVGPEQIENRKQEMQRLGRRVPSDAQLTQQIRREQFRDFWDDHWYLEATGLFVAIALIYFAGLLLGNFLGRKIYTRVEALISRMPGFKQVYPYVKQVVELVIGDKPMAFSRVVLVQYPRNGIWTMGFVTSRSMRSITEAAGGQVLAVFIPTSPTPFTGFTINVYESEVIDLPLTMDEALRFVITGGVLVPDRDRPAEGEAARLAEEARARLASNEAERAEKRAG